MASLTSSVASVTPVRQRVRKPVLPQACGDGEEPASCGISDATQRRRMEPTVYVTSKRQALGVGTGRLKRWRNYPKQTLTPVMLMAQQEEDEKRTW